MRIAHRANLPKRRHSLVVPLLSNDRVDDVKRVGVGVVDEFRDGHCGFVAGSQDVGAFFDFYVLVRCAFYLGKFQKILEQNWDF